MAAPVTVADLEVLERNDPDIPVTLTHQGDPIDLTGAGIEVEAYFKTNEQQDDDDDSVTVLSTTDGTITLDDGENGGAVLHIPASALPVAAPSRFWRVDVVDSGKRHTCVLGKLIVTGI